MRHRGVVLFLLGGLLVASEVNAAISVGDHLYFVGYPDNNSLTAYGITAYGQGNGGEFIFVDSGSSPVQNYSALSGDQGFLTFCVQINSNIYIPTTTGPYVVTGLSQNQTGNSDSETVPNFAKWLAYEVYSATSPSSAFFVNSTTLAGEIQYAIWTSENPGYSQSTIFSELGISDQTTETNYANQYTSWLNQFNSNPSANNLLALNVEVAQLADYPNSGDQNQNQLVLVATSPNFRSPVPEPATLAIWGLGAGLAGAAALRRRKQPGGRWSEEDRKAIFQVIHAKS